MVTYETWGIICPPNRWSVNFAPRPLIEWLAEGPRGHGDDLHHHGLAFRGQRRGMTQMLLIGYFEGLGSERGIA